MQEKNCREAISEKSLHHPKTLILKLDCRKEFSEPKLWGGKFIELVVHLENHILRLDCGKEFSEPMLRGGNFEKVE